MRIFRTYSLSNFQAQCTAVWPTVIILHIASPFILYWKFVHFAHLYQIPPPHALATTNLISFSEFDFSFLLFFGFLTPHISESYSISFSVWLISLSPQGPSKLLPMAGLIIILHLTMYPTMDYKLYFYFLIASLHNPLRWIPSLLLFCKWRNQGLKNLPKQLVVISSTRIWIWIQVFIKETPHFLLLYQGLLVLTLSLLLVPLQPCIFWASWNLPGKGRGGWLQHLRSTQPLGPFLQAKILQTSSHYPPCLLQLESATE